MVDTQIRQALVLLHDNCTQNWTLEALAQQCGLSRTGLAERFRKAMNDTPLNYLRTVRIQNAMRLLSETEQTLEQVAQAVGYQDAFSFSKAFKRTVGMAPEPFANRTHKTRRSLGVSPPATKRAQRNHCAFIPAQAKSSNPKNQLGAFSKVTNDSAPLQETR